MIKQVILGSFLLLISLGLVAAPSTLDVDEQTKLPFWPSISTATGGLLLVQGKGSHGYRLLTIIAAILSNRGWSVAVVPTSLASDQFSEQLSSYLAKLRQQTKLKVGIVWYGDDYHQLLTYFSKPQAKQVSGLVLLSAYQYSSASENESWQLRFPVLDIIAQFDYRPVIKDSLLRQRMIGKKYYLKRTIPGAGHDYRYQEHYLSAEIDNWLTKIPSPKVGRVF